MSAKLTVEVDYGPGIVNLIKLLEAVQVILELVPEWSAGEAQEAELAIEEAVNAMLDGRTVKEEK